MTTMHNNFAEAIFRPDFPLSGPHLIAASAGTGKTYNIQNIYARLIMECGFQVSRLQVMTYTDAATKELRDRLHAVLTDVHARLQTPPADCQGKDAKDTARRNERADRLIACLSAEQRPLALARVELALLDFDQAAISTIHGFCQRALTRYTLETGLKFNQDIQDTKSDDLATLATDWWRTRPTDAPADIDLGTLQKFVSILSQKAIYDVEPPDESTAEGYLLARALEIVQSYEANRANRDSLNFDDLLRALYDALNGPQGDRLAAQMGEDFQAALIDEFQDTDPVQYAIFQRVFLAKDGFPLYFVGDPKQAIYAFRGGDIYTYLNAAAAIGDDRSYVLSVNHRSTARLMDAVNDIFLDSADEDGQPIRTFGDAQIAYDMPVLVEEEPQIKGHALSQPFTVVTMTDKKDIQTELVARIKATLAEQDEEGKPVFTPKDLVILLNSHSWEQELRDRLRALGIPSVIAKSGNVFFSPVAVELRLFLQAVAHPHDKRNVLAALSTVFADRSLQEIQQLEETPDQLAETIADFSELRNVWTGRGFAALIPKLEARGYQLRLASRPDGERQLADLRQILELAFAAIKRKGPSPDALLDWLTERLNQAGEEADTPEYTRCLESDGDAVKIMTIHASKGLQFPVVFLPDCWKVNSDKDPRNKIIIPAYHNADKGGRLTFSLSDQALEAATQEKDMEKIRLLYVAMTRAVQQTILLKPTDSAISNGEPLPQLLQNAMDNGNKRLCQQPDYISPIVWIQMEAPTETDDSHGFSSKPLDEELFCLTPAKNFDLSPLKGSYSALSPSVTDSIGAEDEERDLDTSDHSQAEGNADFSHDIFRIAGGATIGTCWHNILEKLNFQAEKQEISDLATEELLCSGFDTEQPLPGTPKTILDLTVEMLEKTLVHSLKTPDGAAFSLRDTPWEHRLSEQEFDFASGASCKSTRELAQIIAKHWNADASKKPFLQAMDNWDRQIPRGFLNGFIDLIIQHGDFFYIIDWKSNSLEGKLENFRTEGITREMATHGYFFQYLLYATVLHAYLKQTLGQDYSWEKNFGGIRYYFLRGIAADGECAVFADRPSAELLDELGHALGLTKED